MITMGHFRLPWRKSSSSSRRTMICTTALTNLVVDYCKWRQPCHGRRLSTRSMARDQLHPSATALASKKHAHVSREKTPASTGQGTVSYVRGVGVRECEKKIKLYGGVA